MIRILLLLVMCFAPTAATAAVPDPAKVYSEEEALRIGWPSANGPLGNYLPLRTSVAITRDLSRARVLWRSEEALFGTAKTGSQSYATAAAIASHIGPTAKSFPGNWAHPIVAEGKVFFSTFRPVGVFREGELKGERLQFRIDAEDLVFALDAKTGKTLWTASEPGGIVQAGGKRGGFQVSPAYGAGKVFSMGSTGRLFAHDAGTGKRLWVSDIGPAHAAAAKERDEMLAAAKQGLVKPDGPGWHSSLVVAEGVLIVPDFRGARDSGLRGVDAQTGALKWEVRGAISKYATANVWRHEGREFVLAANLAGEMRLIDPREGKVLWTVSGLGPNYVTLAPSATHVLVNVTKTDPAVKRSPGHWGAYRITPQGAELAWKMPAEAKYQIPTWMDSCARQRYLMRDGLAYVQTDGTAEEDGRFLLMKETTGEILAEREIKGPDVERLGGMFYLVNDTVLARADSSHGSMRGGRHPFVQWSVMPGRIARFEDAGKPMTLDLTDFATAYEVHMETPIVAGLMFERTVDGGLTCIDLRADPKAEALDLRLEGMYLGQPTLLVRMVLSADGSVESGRAMLPDQGQAGLIYGKCRNQAVWERIENTDAKKTGDRLEGLVAFPFGTDSALVRIELAREGGGLSGTWARSVAGLEKPVPAAGAITGRGPSASRLFPTTWLKDNPWTKLSENPAGTSTFVLQLGDAITLKPEPRGLTVSLDHDGTRFTRAAACSLGFNQAWHEVDASGLTLKDGRITGRLTVILHGDWYFMPAPGSQVVARYEIDATVADDAITGTHKGELGVPWSATGKAAATKVP